MNDLNRMELKISKFLRLGVIISGSIISIGWFLSFKFDQGTFVPFKTYRPFNILDSLQMNFILQNWGNLIIYLGLAILISLPVLRVFLSILLFLKQKERAMAIIGSVVLLGLILSFTLGIEA